MSVARRLFHQATGMIRSESLPETVTPSTLGCACCGRPWAEVEDPNEAIGYRYGSGYASEWVCTTCYTPRLPAFEALGVERMAGGGNTPVGGKLGMLPKSGGIITSKREMHLALPAGFINRFGGGALGRRGQLHQCTPMSLLVKLYFAGFLDSDAFVYIHNFGRKPDRLMADFQPTLSLSELWLNSAEGAVSMDFAALIATSDALIDMGLADQATKPAWWKPILDAASGHRDNDALSRWQGSVPDAHLLLSSLPVDPHDRLRMVPVLREIIANIQRSAA